MFSDIGISSFSKIDEVLFAPFFLLKAFNPYSLLSFFN